MLQSAWNKDHGIQERWVGLRLEDIREGMSLRGVLPGCTVTVVNVQWHGADALSMIYRTQSGRVAEEILYRDDEQRLEPAERKWSFGGDGKLFRLVSEAYRIRMAHLFDPLLAVHISRRAPAPPDLSGLRDHAPAPAFALPPCR